LQEEKKNNTNERNFMIEEIMHDFYRIEIPLPLLELQLLTVMPLKIERHLIIDTGWTTILADKLWKHH
jgi:hypothetical protein